MPENTPRISHRLLAFLGVIALVLIAVFFSLRSSNTSPVKSESTERQRPGESQRIVFPLASMEFEMPRGWTPVENVVLPRDIDGFLLGFQKEGTSCILAYANPDRERMYESYQQTSFADRVFGPGGEFDRPQYDSSWYIRKADSPVGFEFQWEGRARHEKEVRIMSHAFTDTREGFGVFLLFDEKGGIVADECNRDANSVLASILPYYETVDLTAASEGVLYRHHGKLMFRGRDDVPRIVSDLGTSDAQVYENAVYFIKDEKALTRIDPFTKTEKSFEFPLSRGAVINSFHIDSGSAYVLVGDPCGYMDECGQRLYGIELVTGKTVLLAEEALNHIEGIDPVANALVVEMSWGDAGCWATTVYHYPFVEGSLKELGKFDGCEHDEVSAGMANRTEVVKNVRGTVRRYAAVSGGTLRPVSETYKEEWGTTGFTFIE